MHLLKILVVFCTFLFFTACQTDNFDAGHQIGFDEGFKAGFQKGKTEGFSLGNKQGYDSGYVKGTLILVKAKWIPTVGGSVLIFIAVVLLMLLYVLFYTKIKLLREKWKSYLVLRSANNKAKTKQFITFKSKATKTFILVMGVLACVAGIWYYFKQNPNVRISETKSQVSSPQKTQELANAISSNVVVNGDQLIEAGKQAELGKNSAFASAIYNLYERLSSSIANSLSLSADEKLEMNQLLKERYPEISDEVRTAYLTGIKNLNSQPITTVTSSAYTTRAQVLSDAINSTICSFSNLLLDVFRLNPTLTTNVLACYLFQDPCEVMMAGITDKIGQKIYEAGVIHDLKVTTSTLMIQKEAALSEIATATTDIKVNMSDTIYRSLGDWFTWNAASLQIYYNVSLRYGFDLSTAFVVEINDEQRQIIVHLPQPKLLSASLDPLFTDAEDGGVSDLRSSDFRHLFDLAENNAIHQAEKNRIKERANLEMKTILTYIYEPFLNNNYPYRLQIINSNNYEINN